MGSNPYIGQLAPGVGGGLGGLPRRSVVTQQPSISKAGNVWSGSCLSTSCSGALVSNNGVAALSESSAVVVLADSYAGAIRAEVLNLEGNSVSSGALKAVATGLGAGAQNASVCCLSSNTAVLSFSDTGTMKFSVLTVSGTTISGGALTSGAAGNYNTVLSVNEFLAIAFYTNAASLYAVLLTVSGTTVTVGTPVLVGGGGGNLYYPSASQIGQGKYICSFADSVKDVRSVTVSVSGSVITAGTAVVVKASTGSSYSTVTAISDVIALVGHGGSSNAGATIVTVSGLTLTVGIFADFGADYYGFIPSASIYLGYSTSVFFSMENSSGTLIGYSVSVSSGTPVAGKPVASRVTGPGSPSLLMPACAKLKSDVFLAAITNTDTSQFYRWATPFYAS